MRRLIAILALLGSATLLEYMYRPVMAVKDEMAWGEEQKQRTL